MYSLSIGDVIAVTQLLYNALSLFLSQGAQRECKSAINFIETLQTLLKKIESELKKTEHERLDGTVGGVTEFAEYTEPESSIALTTGIPQNGAIDELSSARMSRDVPLQPTKPSRFDQGRIQDEEDNDATLWTSRDIRDILTFADDLKEKAISFLQKLITFMEDSSGSPKIPINLVLGFQKKGKSSDPSFLKTKEPSTFCWRLNDIREFIRKFSGQIKWNAKIGDDTRSFRRDASESFFLLYVAYTLLLNTNDGLRKNITEIHNMVKDLRNELRSFKVLPNLDKDFKAHSREVQECLTNLVTEYQKIREEVAKGDVNVKASLENHKTQYDQKFLNIEKVLGDVLHELRKPTDLSELDGTATVMENVAEIIGANITTLDDIDTGDPTPAELFNDSGNEQQDPRLILRSLDGAVDSQYDFGIPRKASNDPIILTTERDNQIRIHRQDIDTTDFHVSSGGICCPSCQITMSLEYLDLILTPTHGTWKTLNRELYFQDVGLLFSCHNYLPFYIVPDLKNETSDSQFSRYRSREDAEKCRREEEMASATFASPVWPLVSLAIRASAISPAAPLALFGVAAYRTYGLGKEKVGSDSD